MLYTGVNHFNWSVDNHSDSAFGGGTSSTTLTADGSNHTKGTDTAILSALAYDCWGMQITVGAGSTDTAARRQMIDILVDPAGGTSWSVLINNIFTNSPGVGSGMFGQQFYFPIFVPAGSTIGARMQDLVGGSTCKLAVRVYGQPTRPDLVKVGHKVQTIGAVTGTTSGAGVTVGVSGAAGSYSSSLGTLTNDAWWWQLGVGSNDSSLSVNSYLFDIAYDATTKYIAARGIPYLVTVNTEQAGKSSAGAVPPFMHAPAGTDVYVRGCCVGSASDTTITTVVYAVT